MHDINEQVNDIEYLLRQLQKIDSKMIAGQFIPAWRSQRKLIAELESKKLDLIHESKTECCTASKTITNIKEKV
jgi:hypothetical protein